MYVVLAFQRQVYARQQMAVRVPAVLRCGGKRRHLRADQTRRAPVDIDPVFHEHEPRPNRPHIPERAGIGLRVQMKIDVVARIVQKSDECLQYAGASMRKNAICMFQESGSIRTVAAKTLWGQTP